MENRSIKRRIASLHQRVIEHEQKIAAEQALIHPDHGLIKHWPVEIDAFNISLKRAQKRIG
jgi:hypothetical protein